MDIIRQNKCKGTQFRRFSDTIGIGLEHVSNMNLSEMGHYTFN